MTTKRSMTLLLAAAAIMLGTGAAHAQTKLSDKDQQFIQAAAEGGHAEVSMGESAAKSANQDIATFGKQMVDEHGKMNDELATLAKAKGYEPPASADLGSQAKGAVIGALPGATFDKQYVSGQLTDHQTTLDLFKAQAQNGDDPELKAFAAKYVPTVEQHFAELETLQKKPELQ